MLKLKDNTDVEIIEKYGFRRHKLFNGAITEFRRTYFEYPDTITSILDDTYEIIDWCDAFTYDWGERESILVDDLIKDGIAEKVDE